MDNTLRRKMFRVGGEVNTHGVGITSGLEYRRPGYNVGGKVAPIGQVGKGPLQMKGPDGKMREMQNPLALLRFLVPGLTSISKIGSRAKRGGLEALKRYFKPKTGRGPGGERVVPGASIRTTTPRGTTIRSKTIKTPGDRLPPGFKDYFKMAPRYLGAGVGGAGILGGVSSLFERGEPETALGSAFEAGRGLSEGAFNLMTGAPSFIAQSPFRSVDEMQLPSTMIREKLYGPEKEEEKVKVGPTDLVTSPVMETAMTQEEQLAKMTADAAIRAEMYYNMLSEGGPDKVRALADAFTNAGMLYDEDKSKALAGFSQGITGELDKDAVLKDEARRLGLTDIVTGEQTLLADAKAKAQAIENAKLAIASSTELKPQDKANTLAQFEAFLEGITEVLPINQDNEMDTNRMDVGRAYFDAQRITGGVFVAVNSEQDIQSFNSAQEALAHAAS